MHLGCYQTHVQTGNFIRKDTLARERPSGASPIFHSRKNTTNENDRATIWQSHVQNRQIGVRLTMSVLIETKDCERNPWLSWIMLAQSDMNFDNAEKARWIIRAIYTAVGRLNCHRYKYTILSCWYCPFLMCVYSRPFVLQRSPLTSLRFVVYFKYLNDHGYAKKNIYEGQVRPSNVANIDPT